MGIFDRIKSGLAKTRNSVMKQIDGVFKSSAKIDEEFFQELEDILVMADVGVVTSQYFIGRLKAKVKNSGASDPKDVRRLLMDVMIEELKNDVSLNLSSKPSVILVIGVNGVGKTTSIGKLAANLKSEGKKVLIVRLIHSAPLRLTSWLYGLSVRKWILSARKRA